MFESPGITCRGFLFVHLTSHRVHCPGRGRERVEGVQSSQKGVSTQLSAHQGPVQNLLGKSRAHNKQKPQKSLASKALLCWAERVLSEPFCCPDSSFHAEFYHT
jgi:hypothetical protein